MLEFADCSDEEFACNGGMNVRVLFLVVAFSGVVDIMRETSSPSIPLKNDKVNRVSQSGLASKPGMN